MYVKHEKDRFNFISAKINSAKSLQDIESAKINSARHALFDPSSAKINSALINSLKVVVQHFLTYYEEFEVVFQIFRNFKQLLIDFS